MKRWVLGMVLKGTIEHNLPLFRNRGETITAGLRFTISAALQICRFCI